MIIRQTFLLFTAAVLAACGPSEDEVQTQEPTDGTQAQGIVDDTSEDTSVPYPYKTYCFQRVGQVGADPKQGESCSFHGNGAGEKTGDGRNGVSLHLSAPSLDAIGMDSVYFVLYVGHGEPKFLAGVQVMDQVIRGTGPDRLLVGSDKSRKSSYFTLSGPEADLAREKIAPSELRGYEVASAVLTIDRAVDRNDLEADLAPPGHTLGTQYVEGTLSVSFIPMGSEGEQYGPTTFEFGTDIDWGMVP